MSPVISPCRLPCIRLKNADPELRTRLAEWLAYHLSNFEYVWPWPKWGHVLTAPPHHPQRCASMLPNTRSHAHVVFFTIPVPWRESCHQKGIRH